MSDHIDGPRQIGDPASDLTDLFAFTSQADPARTVLVANVFPTCGVDANFSNAVDHSIAMRRAKATGSGEATRFEVGDQEIRFRVRFDPLEHATGDAKPVQRGVCVLPDGQNLQFVANDENGAATPDGVYRIFAGLRSDPFILAWIARGNTMTPSQNLLDQDNVLSIVIEFDTRRVLDPTKGSLFAVIAETTPRPRPGGFVGHPPPRFDWVGRPEQTNMRLNNASIEDKEDLRDLWNQQAPFAISDELRPLFRKRLKDSLANWDMRDKVEDWPEPALLANANMFLDDFLLIDVAKPITDTSFLEIEKSTLNGRPHATGGGRTVDCNVFDILMTWLINRDRQALRGGALKSTKPAQTVFPYLATPNVELQSVRESVDLNASPDQVWGLVGVFAGAWHPLIASIRQVGAGPGALRIIETVDGKQMIERLEQLDAAQRLYRYSCVSGLPVSTYMGVLQVKPRAGGCTVEWQAEFLASGQGTLIVRTIISALFKSGLNSLKARF